jgi:hypothetical protein
MKTKSKRTSNINRSDTELSENAVGRNAIVYEGDEKRNDRIDNNNDDNNIKDKTVVPLEIDTHFQMYGKHVWEVEYKERCPLCNKRIDEYGFCACGSGGQ